MSAASTPLYWCLLQRAGEGRVFHVFCAVQVRVLYFVFCILHFAFWARCAGIVFVFICGHLLTVYFREVEGGSGAKDNHRNGGHVTDSVMGASISAAGGAAAAAAAAAAAGGHHHHHHHNYPPPDVALCRVFRSQGEGSFAQV